MTKFYKLKRGQHVCDDEGCRTYVREDDIWVESGSCKAMGQGTFKLFGSSLKPVVLKLADITEVEEKISTRPYKNESDLNLQLCTRDGRPVEILSAKGRGKRCIKGYVGDSQNVSGWCPSGAYYEKGVTDYDDSRDLFVITKERVKVTQEHESVEKPDFADLAMKLLKALMEKGISYSTSTHYLADRSDRRMTVSVSEADVTILGEAIHSIMK